MTKLKDNIIELLVFAVMNVLAIGATTFGIVALIEYLK